MSRSIESVALVLGVFPGLGAYLLLTKSNNRRGSGSAGRLGRVRTSPREIAVALAMGVAFAVVALVVSGVIGIAVAAGFVGLTLTHFIRSRRRSAVQRTIEGSYPDLIENLIARVRSGSGLLDALAHSAEGAPAAIAGPARQFWKSVQVSGAASACLDDLKEAWSSPTGDLLIETVRVAHDAGGTRVVEVLRELADQVRRERNIRRDVEAKQSWVRVAARIGVAAPWVVLVLLSLRSEAASAYNSPAGIALIVCGLALSVVSYRLMISLGRTPSPRRVFGR
jgi:tight adherence protein B